MNQFLLGSAILCILYIMFFVPSPAEVVDARALEMSQEVSIMCRRHLTASGVAESLQDCLCLSEVELRHGCLTAIDSVGAL